MKSYLNLFGLGCFGTWLVLGIGPVLLHRDAVGHAAKWYGHKEFFNFYYFVSIVGGWQWLILFSILCFAFSFAKTLTSSKHLILVAAITALVSVLLVAFTRNFSNQFALELE